MKTFLTTFSILLFSLSLIAQAPPEAINYSGVARDNSGLPLINTAIGLELSVLETTSTGTAIYTEEHSTTTDDYGRFDVAIGMGTPTTGTFSAIDWGGDSHFLSVGMDVSGGTSYQAMGTTQMLSVPYALYAKEAGTMDMAISQMGDTLFNGNDTLIIPGISSANGGNSYYTPGGGVTDIDGNQYVTVVLANGQEWMADNLRTTTYANGDPISNITDDNDWANLNTGAWCWFNNDGIYDVPRGKLYNWFAVDDPRNVCPSGWHVPSFEDMTSLIILLGGTFKAGGSMKYPGSWWHYPEFGATNESGLNVFPSGFRHANGGTFTPEYLFMRTHFWMDGSYQDGQGDTVSHSLHITHNAENLQLFGRFPNEGASIRCIKD